jgi:hypothetical protein
VPGSIKGDVKRKHYPYAGAASSSLTSSPVIGSCLPVEVRSSSVAFISALRRPSLAEATQAWRWQNANHGSIGDSRRSAALWLCWVVRGSIWCPVRLGAYGARSLTRPGYLPSNPSAQPNGKARSETRPLPAELRAQAACDFRYSALKGSPFFHTCKVMAAILRARVSRAISGFIPFVRRFW